MKVNRLLAGTLALVLVAGFGIPAYGGGVACGTSATLAVMINLPTNCIEVDDKIFTNFRNFNGNFDPAQITVTGVTVGTEKGLQFTSQTLSTGTPPQNIGIVFEYDVISNGDPISDNTLTLDSFVLTDPFGTLDTRIVVEEMVFDQQGQIAFKDVSADGLNNQDLLDHVDYPSLHQMVSVNVDIGIALGLGCEITQLCFVSISQFTQTFSQSPEPEPLVGGELLPIDNTALVLAGLQTSAIWMLPVLAGVAGSAFAILYIKSRRN